MKSSYDLVICGAGIAGITTAYLLARKHDMANILLVDERAPMSLTSDKSTECYRNWWPGPGDGMVRMMNRSIDLIEEIAIESGNVFHLNQRGYLYCTAQPDGVAGLEAFAREASALGAGEVRIHEAGSSSYQPHEAEGFGGISGADLLIDPALIQIHFPYLGEQITAVLHVRRAGWLSAQQFGQYMLEQVRVAGVEFASDRIEDVKVEDGRVVGVQLKAGGEVEARAFLNAAGPMLAEVGQMIGVEIPVINELHLKASINDEYSVLDRNAPLVIFNDAQALPWSDEEKAWLAEDEESNWLLGTLPGGAHTRPEGAAAASSIIMLWDIDEHEVEPIFPPPLDPMYAEMAVRGLSGMIPGFSKYPERMPKPYLDGGYYTKTQENRPLACALLVEGAFVIGALSGYGIMASAGMAELAAAHIAGADLPAYADLFDIQRYEDPDYQSMLADWGDSWQL